MEQLHGGPNFPRIRILIETSSLTQFIGNNTVERKYFKLRLMIDSITVEFVLPSIYWIVVQEVWLTLRGEEDRQEMHMTLAHWSTAYGPVK